jgi:hypothetical protein
MNLTEKIFLLGLGLLVIILVSVTYLNKNDAAKLLKERYEAALLGTDKEAALEAGRAYYRSLRGRELSAADEEAIRKDIALMPDTDEPLA